MTLEVLTRTAEDTREVGAALSSLLRAHDVVVLTGELGAGKTTLVQGIARGLGVQDTVGSPTFTLVREYEGVLDIAHVDVYRLDRLQDVMDLGLDELAGSEGVMLVEWGDAVEQLLPADRLLIELYPDDPTYASEDRRISFSGPGTSWVERWPGVEAALASWSRPS